MNEDFLKSVFGDYKVKSDNPYEIFRCLFKACAEKTKRLGLSREFYLIMAGKCFGLLYPNTTGNILLTNLYNTILSVWEDIDG